MRLEDIMLQVAPGRSLPSSRTQRRLEVRGLTPDAQRVGPGTVFVALPDRQRADPLEAYRAADRGAAAAICEADAVLPHGLARIEVPDCRQAFARAAAAFFGHPERSLEILAIRTDRATGSRRPSTNRTHLLAGLLARDGHAVACFSELSCHAAGRTLHRPLSGLDLFQLFDWLAQAVRSGTRRAVWEIDPTLEATLSEEFPVRWCGSDPVRPQIARLSGQGSVLELGGQPVSTRLVGPGNLTALATAVDMARRMAPNPPVVGRVPRLEGTPGFLEPVRAGQPFGVFVDGARTPDEVQEAITELNSIQAGQVQVVLGGPAEMDAEGRRRLGAATAGARQVWITADDPGDRSVTGLSAEVAAGTNLARCRMEPNRERAIFGAIAQARADDLVLVTGKAHRPTETVAGVTMPCDDRRTLYAALAARGYGGTRLEAGLRGRQRERTLLFPL